MDGLSLDLRALVGDEPASKSLFISLKCGQSLPTRSAGSARLIRNWRTRKRGLQPGVSGGA